jgi:hypothetical protein
MLVGAANIVVLVLAVIVLKRYPDPDYDRTAAGA